MRLLRIVGPAALLALSACTPKPALPAPEAQPSQPTEVITKKLTEAEWKQRLTPEQYHVCRQGGTERAGSGALLNVTAAGVYNCVACGQALFQSDTKYESECGWPSFWTGIEGTITKIPSGNAFEAKCSNCDSHLGHIFNDGPPPTGKRY